MFQESEKRNSKVLRNTSPSINQVHSLSYLKKPLLSVLICYIAGILFQNIFRNFNDHWLFFLCSLILMVSLLSFKKNQSITTILLFLFFLLIGMLNTSYHLRPHGSQNIYHFAGEEGFLFGTVYQLETKKTNTYQEIQVNTHFFQIQDKRYQANGLVLLKVYGDQPFLRYGDIVRAEVLLKKPALPGNFGELNYRDYLVRQNIFLTDSIEAEQIQIKGHSQKINVFSLIQNIKCRITEKIDQIYQSPGKGLIKAIIIGDRTEISQEWIHFFQDAGVMHILAISGLHVGILAMLLFYIFNLIPRCWIKNIFKYFVMILILLGYAAMTGFSPSASRATLMFIIILVARYLNRPYHLHNSIYLSALIILLWQPLYLFDAGFLLSFVVTFFIIYLAPILEVKLSLLPTFFRKSFSVSLSAWLGMAPLSAYFFYKISFIAIISNLFIVPLIGIILILAMISILLSFLLPSVAVLLASSNQTLISLLLLIGKKLSSLPFAYQYYGQPEIYSIILSYLIILVFFYTFHFWSQYSLPEKKKGFWMISILVFLFLVIPVISFSSLLSVHFINVGEGDCIFIQTPQKKNILIDGGGTPFNEFDVGMNTVIPYLRRNGIHRIDIVVLTHPDLDHLEGLVAVLKEMEVNAVIDSGIENQNKTYTEFLSLIQKNDNVNYYKTEAGDTIRLCADLEFIVLSPSKSFLIDHCENNFNNHSIVLKLRYKKTNFLFTGDIEETTEKNLLSWNDMLKTDILKVAHHGSNSSSTELFIEKVRPRVAVISVGPNHFDHPHQEVVQRLENVCHKVFRTDLNGTVLIKSNGREYYISTLR